MKPALRQDIELLRLACALAIVWFHAQVPGWHYAYVGLVIFIVISVFLSKEPEGIGVLSRSHLLNRARRLLLPWLLWSLIYGLASLLTGKTFWPVRASGVAEVLAGTCYHLWYLPFMFVALLALDLLRVRFRRSTLADFGAMGCMLAMAMAPGWRESSLAAGYPWAQYAQAAPALLLGLFIQGWQVLPRGRRTAYLLVLLVSFIWRMPLEGVGLPYLLGLIILVPTLTCPQAWLQRFDLRRLSACTLGVYMVHPLFLTANNKFDVSDGVWAPLLAFASSLVFVLLLKKLLPRISTVLV